MGVIEIVKQQERQLGFKGGRREGRLEGHQEGRQEGLQEGLEKGKAEVEVPVAFVSKVRASLKAKK